MGYFVLPEGNTKEDLVNAAITNLELWQQNPSCDHLLLFAKHNIENAQKLEKDIDED